MGANANGCTGCGSNGTNVPAGVYTTVRFAIDDSGSQIAETPNQGGIEREWLAIATTSSPISESDPNFLDYFAGKWIRFGCCSNGGGVCTFFPYQLPRDGGGNVWQFSGGIYVGGDNDNSVSNAIKVASAPNGSKFSIDSLRDNENQLLQSGVDYYVEFEYLFDSLNAGDFVRISLGDGPNASVIEFDSNFGDNETSFVLTAENGQNFNASSLVIEVITSGSNASFQINNIRFATAYCDPNYNGSVIPQNFDADDAVLEWGYTWLQDFDYFFFATKWRLNGITYEEYISGTITLNPSDPTDDRIDGVVIDLSKNFQVITGTPAPAPAGPDITDGQEVLVTFLTVPAGGTEPTGANIVDVYDENLGQPSEWNTVSELFNAGAVINFDYATNPQNGAKNIQFTSVLPDVPGEVDSVNFNIPGFYNSATNGTTQLRFWMRVPGAQNAGLRVRFKDTVNGIQSNFVMVTDGSYGFQSGVLSWQQILIPIADLTVGLNIFNQIELQNKAVNTTVFLDRFQLIEGIGGGSSGVAVPNRTSQLINDGENGDFKFIESSSQTKYIRIEGQEFEYRALFGTNGSSFTAGDLALNGWISQTKFGKVLSYVSGDPTLFSSWEVIESIG